MKKLSLKDATSMLSRKEMRNIMAGSVGCPPNSCGSGGTCYFWVGDYLSSGCSCFKNNIKISGTC